MLTPGAYLRQCREAAGLTLDDVALCTETLPPVCARSRGEWLATIEADTAPLAIGTALRLHTIFPFDFEVLVALSAEHAGVPAPASELQLVMHRVGAVTITFPDPSARTAA